MSHTAPAPTAREDRDVRRSVLPGGLRVVTEHRPDRHGVHLGWFVGVGSRDESARQHGCSHVLEHVLFKGTQRRSAAQISGVLEERGGDLNAWTARDHTAFHARVLHQDLPLAVDVLGDMLTGSLIRSHDLDSEKQVILDEIAMHRDDPAELAQDLAQAALFAGDPLGRPVIGTEESITALSRGQVRAFWQRHYRSDDLVVAAVGPVQHEDLVQLLGGLELPTAPPGNSGTAARRRPVVPVPAADPVVEESRLQQTSVTLAFPGYPREDPRRYALSLLTTVLGGGMSSRLFQRVREERALAYAIEASDASWGGAGIATIDWQALPGRTVAIVDEVRSVVGRVLDEGLGERELAAAATLVTGQTLLALDSASASMARLGLSWLDDDLLTVAQVLERYRAVTPQDVLVVAREVFARRPVVALTGARARTNALARALNRW